jgi:hypothetical protein
LVAIPEGFGDLSTIFGSLWNLPWSFGVMAGSGESTMQTVLVVEDDPIIRIGAVLIVEEAG